MTGKRFRISLAWLLLGLSSVAWAQDYVAQWGPAIGTAMPILQAQDQAGNSQNLNSLAGEQGLLLFLNRSADW